MAEVQHLVQVSDYEQRLMVNGLNAFRNDLIRDGKPTEDINALLIKVIDAPEKKPKRKIGRIDNEFEKEVRLVGHGT